MKKRIIALVLAIMMVLPVGVSHAYIEHSASEMSALAKLQMSIFDGTSATYPDTVGTEAQNAINFLSKLGIMEEYKDGLFEPELNITRAQMAVIAVKLMGMDGEYSYDKSFPTACNDVPAGYWCSDFINKAISLGIMSAYEGNFNPEEYVTGYEAVKMMMSALGYDVVARLNGGWPLGYVEAARQANVLKNLPEMSDAPISRGDLAILIYNALNTEVLKQTSFGDRSDFETTENVTLLYDKSEIYKGNGQVDANSVSTLIGKSTLKKDEVTIDGVVYKVGNTNAFDLLGLQVTFYYREDEGIKTLMHLEMNENRNSMLFMEAQDIQDYKDYTYYYEDEDGYVREAAINSQTDVLYNGVVIDDYPDYIMKPDGGFVILLASDGGSRYDVCLIYEYVDFPVATVNLEEGIVYNAMEDHNLASHQYFYSLDLSENENGVTKTIRDTSGKKISYSSIRQGDMLSVARSLDGESVNVVVSKANTVRGSVGTVAYKEGKIDRITIDTAEYKYSSYCSVAVEPDDVVVAYINIDGKIAYLELESSSGYKYAILLDIGQAKGASDDVLVKMYVRNSASNAEVVDYTLFKRVGVTANAKYTTAAESGEGYGTVTKAFATASEFASYVPVGNLFENQVPAVSKVQLVRFKANSENEIMNIEFSHKYEYKEGSENNGMALDKAIEYVFASEKPDEYLRQRFTTGSANGYWERTPRMFNYIPAKLQENAPVFVVPKNTGEYEKYRLSTHWEFTAKTNYKNTYGYFTKQDEPSASVVVTPLREGADSIIYYAENAVVKSVASALNASGAASYKLDLFLRGTEESLVLANPDMIDDIEAGDVVKYNKNKQGEIDGLVKTFDKGTKTVLATGDFARAGGQNYAVAYDIIDSMLIQPSSGNEAMLNTLYTDGIGNSMAGLWYPIIGEGAYITIVEKISAGSYRCRKGNITDIVTYKQARDDASKLLVDASYCNVKQIIIFK